MKSFMQPELYEYLINHCPLPHPILEKVRHETALRPDARMQIAPDQGMFLHQIVRLMGARRAVEVGCFTGYSAIAMGSAIAPGGKLITLDVNPETAAIARGYFREAKLDDRIELRLGDGVSALDRLIQDFGVGSFDLAFIDADKANYQHYFDSCLTLIRPGGLILVDNVLWDGKVIDLDDQSIDTQAIRVFNDKLMGDHRVEKMMLPIADGLFWCTKK